MKQLLKNKEASLSFSHTKFREVVAGQPPRLSRNFASDLSLHDTDALGETLLFKVVKFGDSILGKEPRLMILSVSDQTKLASISSTTARPRSLLLSQERTGQQLPQVATYSSSPSVVRFLLDYKVDPFVGNYYNPNLDALAQAVMKNRHHVMQCLLDHPLYKWQYRPLMFRGMSLLQLAAHFADKETLDLLGAVRWLTNDAADFINSSPDGVWMPRAIITWRRDNVVGLPYGDQHDDDPQEVYHAFMNLVQKIIDDHYDYGEPRCDGSERRMELALSDDQRLFDIIEESSLIDLSPPVMDVSEAGPLSTDEHEAEWYDALEEPPEGILANS
ncbi:MAG: hypothetical protein Q9222_005613 [Ikaeria aurantiellina]